MCTVPLASVVVFRFSRERDILRYFTPYEMLPFAGMLPSSRPHPLHLRLPPALSLAISTFPSGRGGDWTAATRRRGSNFRLCAEPDVSRDLVNGETKGKKKRGRSGES